MPTAADVMTRNVVTVPEELGVHGLIAMFREQRFGGFPVVGADERAVGVVSQNDVLRALASAIGPGFLPLDYDGQRRGVATQLLEALASGSERAPAAGKVLSRAVSEIMTPRVEACTPTTPLEEVCGTICDLRLHRVVVLDDDRKVIGIVTTTDLVRAFGAALRGK